MINRIEASRYPIIDKKYEPYINRKQISSIGIYQIHLEFPNGFGASIIQGWGTYGFTDGLFELAILYKNDFCMDSGIAEDDVIGYLDDKQVNEYLEKIMNLEERL